MPPRGLHLRRRTDILIWQLMVSVAKPKGDRIMKFRALLSALLLAVGLAFVADGGESRQADSPSVVLKKFLVLMQKQDFIAMAELSYGERRTEALQVVETIKQLKQAAESGDEKAKKELALLQQVLDDAKGGLEKMKVEIKSEKIEGDLAEVDAVVSGTSDKKVVLRQSYFKRVNSGWKIISPNDYKAEKAKATKK